MENIYQQLGISTIINASGSMTELGGSVMNPIVAQAMASASQHYVHLPSMKKNLEERLANILGVEGVHFCAGASAGLILSVAACMTGTNDKRIKRLPDTADIPHIFLTPSVHRNKFDHAIQVAGGKIEVFGNNKEEFEKLVSRKEVAAVYFTLSWFCQGDYLSIPEAAEIAHQYNKAVVVDAAAQVPPIQNFKRFLTEGADLVVFSGGKTIKGPQVSGLIIGKKPLIEACQLNNSPNIQTIGRGMKVSKEEIVALYIATLIYLERDHDRDQLQWKNQLLHLKSQLKNIEELDIQEKYPYGPGYQVPFLEFNWNHTQLKPNAKNLLEKLKQHTIPIYARFKTQTDEHSAIRVYAHTLKVGDEKEIANAMLTAFND